MSTRDPERQSAVAILLATGFMLALVGCGGSGMSGAGSGADASVTIGPGGAGGAGETGGAGGTTALAGNSGQGGVNGLGGSSASGGSSGGQSGSMVSPRVPKNHRPQAGSCAGVFSPPEPVDPPQTASCKKHADCAQGTNGRCIVGNLGSGRGQTYYCVYDECATDSDCDPGKVCHCPAGQLPQCFYQGNCQTDADCGGGAGGFCSPAYGFDCGGYHVFSSYYCHTPKDTCVDDSDCTGKDFCDYDVVVGRWECKSPTMNCAIG